MLRAARRRDWKLFRREWVFFKQRWERGWDDSDTWSLDMVIGRFIAPRLKRFREMDTGGVPGVFLRKENPTDKDFERARTQWNEKLDAMIAAFEIMGAECLASPEQEKIKAKGLRLFAHWCYTLWW